jgi:hypothetical protein
MKHRANLKARYFGNPRKEPQTAEEAEKKKDTNV